MFDWFNCFYWFDSFKAIEGLALRALRARAGGASCLAGLKAQRGMLDWLNWFRWLDLLDIGERTFGYSKAKPIEQLEQFERLNVFVEPFLLLGSEGFRSVFVVVKGHQYGLAIGNNGPVPFSDKDTFQGEA